MATHSSVLAWRIPGMGEPGGLPPMGSHWVRHDWSDLAAAAAAPKRSYSQAFNLCQNASTCKLWRKGHFSHISEYMQERAWRLCHSTRYEVAGGQVDVERKSTVRRLLGAPWTLQDPHLHAAIRTVSFFCSGSLTQCSSCPPQEGHWQTAP